MGYYVYRYMHPDYPWLYGSIAEPEIATGISWWFDKHCNKKDIDKVVML